jgi:putative ABC transport system ATP-binding protein
MTESILAARSLSKSYQLGREKVPAIRNLTVAIGAGEFTALAGPSGSGKTTLLNLFGLLDEPDSGDLTLDGRNVAAISEEERSKLRLARFGFVFQTFNLIPVLTARENVEYPMAVMAVPAAIRRQKALRLLAEVGLSEKEGVRPDLLSGGQRQRVAIARALANDPEIVLADEPTASLDSRTAAEILDLMRQMNKERGTAFVFATHDPRVIDQARRVVVLRDGEIIEERP